MHHWGTCWGSAPQSVFVLAPTCPAVNRRPATRPRAAARRCSAWSAPSAAARPRPRRSSRCTPAAAAPRCWPSSASAAGAAGRAPTCPATSALALLRSPRASPAWRPAWLAEGPARGRAPPGAVRGWQPRRAGGVMSRAGRAAHTGSLAPSALLGARPPGTRPSRPVGSRGCVRQLPGCLLVRSAQPTWALVAAPHRRTRQSRHWSQQVSAAVRSQPSKRAVTQVSVPPPLQQAVVCGSLPVGD
jgi:hypothetical protein